MPAIINSAPECVVSKEGYSADDAADFVVGDNYTECAGFMTFGPGSTYGEDGLGANGAYMVVTWIGIVFMIVALIGWVVYENRRLVSYARTRVRGGPPAEPQPGITGSEET